MHGLEAVDISLAIGGQDRDIYLFDAFLMRFLYREEA